MTTMTKQKSDNQLFQWMMQQWNAGSPAVWLLYRQRMMNMVAAACINNRKSSGNKDGRYKQLIYSGNIGENYKDDLIAQQQ